MNIHTNQEIFIKQNSKNLLKGCNASSIKSFNSNEDNENTKAGRWNSAEHMRFVQGCLKFGNNWKKVKECVKTRSSAQIRSHAQKYLIKLCKKYKIQDNKEFKSLRNIRKKKIISINHEGEGDERNSIENERREGDANVQALEMKILNIFKSNIAENSVMKSNESSVPESLPEGHNYGREKIGKIFETFKISKKKKLPKKPIENENKKEESQREQYNEFEKMQQNLNFNQVPIMELFYSNKLPQFYNDQIRNNQISSYLAASQMFPPYNFFGDFPSFHPNLIPNFGTQSNQFSPLNCITPQNQNLLNNQFNLKNEVIANDKDLLSQKSGYDLQDLLNDQKSFINPGMNMYLLLQNANYGNFLKNDGDLNQGFIVGNDLNAQMKKDITQIENMMGINKNNQNLNPIFGLITQNLMFNPMFYNNMCLGNPDLPEQLSRIVKNNIDIK